ncbi:hypothetical protein VB638_21165 [Dolichospermum sp. UHCC 0684]|jgi:hypothetical protein|uniref:hypothetical protein n=1 Tax=Nostocales TaxID=1161 RepID=UPI00029B71AE|nr:MULTISPECIES: hypothetical protein [Nostocales]AFW93256.1 hypothetical protein ANA_C10455 [Anabaena sp. 90]MEA5532052.1 hypothetical protein [Dolichospermum sp. UHCC 0684]MTJ18723.1 hypothetical protein [Dolichospermum sp. UHCC 0299]MTJ22748.1 hypothetical protein [Dolichospermum sp. UHCC 0352]MTJ37091.1 hypothetical protein [Dolichospermum sp. UHCC 0260]
MLKPLLVSGWFRVKPFLKYIAIVIVISPFLGMSIHATLAKQSEVANSRAKNSKSQIKLAESAATRQLNLQFAQVNSHTGKILVGEGIQSLPKDIVISGAERENSQLGDDVVSKTVPSVNVAQLQSKTSINQANLIQKLKDAKEETDLNSPVSGNSQSQELAISTVTPKNGEIPVSERPNESEMAQTDPIGSPHPIPWQWILATQEAIGAKGGSGVRYYRSIPVISPDGKYAIYSRVQMEVKPEMHNSRVNSVLFVEDRQTKRLRVMTSTSVVIDPLLKRQAILSAQGDNDGKIGVLVPVSWSEKGDRFLARKFVAIFNTADATDQAVIWNRQQDHLNVVSPVQSQDDHEKIAILLGWSKKQPNNVLFRAGELGEENWPLLQVANDGRTVDISAEGDQAVTFGEKGSIWADPQVASR